MFLGSVALVAALAFSTQSVNAQGFNNQPNRNNHYEQHREPNRHATQQQTQHFGPSQNRNVIPAQHFGHQSHSLKKAEPLKIPHSTNTQYHHQTPVVIQPPCHHQPAPQVVVVGQPRKPSLLEKIVHIFR